jgi:flagellar protein FliS
MLFDRLVLDVTLGARALEAGDREAAAHRLLHAQDILLHLRSTLDVESWPPGGALASVYVWCWQELVAANTRQDTGKAVGVLALVTALRDSWQQAARLSQRD